jgi:xanthine dehydrogenase YagS FAD-binding subunit
MQRFQYQRATTSDAALAATRTGDAQYIAGGTTLVDLMRLEVMTPATVVDITGLPLDQIEEGIAGGLKIGALARNATVAHHPLVAKRFPVLAEALLSGASPQLRNMATTGGNLLQRTRCSYFRDGVSSCNKRAPGSGCAALDGYNRMHAILGTSDHCIAAHPSDMCVALLALDAIIHVRGAGGSRRLPISELHVLPGKTPSIEHAITPGELITHVELLATPFSTRSHYVKIRDRSEFAFALASAAVALELRGGVMGDARIALGGVATKPWRAREAEQILAGKPPLASVFQQAAKAALAGASPRGHNTFKVELAKRVIVRALEELTGGAR